MFACAVFHCISPFGLSSSYTCADQDARQVQLLSSLAHFIGRQGIGWELAEITSGGLCFLFHQDPPPVQIVTQSLGHTVEHSHPMPICIHN
jgi:hypothetical protein